MPRNRKNITGTLGTVSQAVLAISAFEGLAVLPEFDAVIVDEAHVVYDLYSRWLHDPAWKDTPFIGLSATPWTKGLAKLWDDLVIGAPQATTNESNFWQGASYVVFGRTTGFDSDPVDLLLEHRVGDDQGTHGRHWVASAGA